MTADEAQAWTAIQKITGGFKQMENAAGKAGRKAKNTFADGIKGAAKFAAQVAGVGSAFGAVFLVIRQLKAEIEFLRKRQAGAAETQIPLAQARNQAIRTAQAGSFKEGDVDRLVNDLSKETGVSTDVIFRGIKNPLSAQGALSKAELKDALIIALRTHKLTGEDFAPLAGGIQDVMRNTGANATQAAGALIASGRALRVPEQEQQISAIVPLIKAGVRAGGSGEEAVELAALSSQVISDIEGAQSATGALRFLNDLRTKALIPETGAAVGFGKTKTTYRKLRSETLQGRIAEAQEFLATATPDQRDRFFTTLGGRIRTKGVYEDLLLRDPETLAEYESAKRLVPSFTGQKVGDTQREFERQAGIAPNAPILRADLRRQKLGVALDEANPNALSDSIRKSLQENLAKIPGVSDLATKFALARFELRSGFGTDRLAGLQAERDIFKGTVKEFGLNRPFERTTFTPTPTGSQTVGPTTFFDEPGVGRTANPAFNEGVSEALQDHIQHLEAEIRALKGTSGTGVPVIKVEIVKDSSGAINDVDPDAQGEGGQ